MNNRISKKHERSNEASHAGAKTEGTNVCEGISLKHIEKLKKVRKLDKIALMRFDGDEGRC